jgi:hypothetical protein
MAKKKITHTTIAEDFLKRIAEAFGLDDPALDYALDDRDEAAVSVVEADDCDESMIYTFVDGSRMASGDRGRDEICSVAECLKCKDADCELRAK